MDIDSLRALLLVVSFSGFVYVFTVLSIVLFGMGLRGSGGGVLAVILGFTIAALAVAGQTGERGGIGDLLDQAAKNPKQFEEKLTPYIEKHGDAELSARLAAAAQSSAQVPPSAAPSLAARQTAFVVAQLRDGFALGMVLLIPFLVIDVLVITVLGLLGTSQVSSALIAVPLKILLFVSVDGWRLITGRLISTLAGNT